MRIRKHHLTLAILLASTSLSTAASIRKKPATDEPLGPPVEELPLHKLSASSPQIGPVPAPETSKATKPNPGTPDAPIDGQDGKPHNGPMIPYDKSTIKSGNTKQIPDVGVSGGGSSVDISKPPPVTGEHEITNLEGKVVSIEDGGKGTKDGHDELDVGTGMSKEKTKDPDAVPEDEGNKKGKGASKVSEGFEDTPKFQQKDPEVGNIPPIESTPSTGSKTSAPLGEGTIESPRHSFALSFLMICFSEVGDKTFLIAALMAMRHSRLLVFSAAFCSLVIMSVLSALLGHTVPTLLPKRFTSFLAAGLFLIFGIRMMNEGLKMEKGTGSVQEEMKEVEQELEEKEAEIMKKEGYASSHRSLEEGGIGSSSRGIGHFQRSISSPDLSNSDSEGKKYKSKRARSAASSNSSAFGSLLDGVQNLASLLFSPAWVQTFVMTFLGEWGDRSQIATIAMAAGQDYWWVIFGTITGHSLCTAGAVLGGRYLASKISVRNVTLGGACAFLIFGVIYLVESFYM